MSDNAAGRLPSESRIALTGADAGPPSDTHTYHIYTHPFIYLCIHSCVPLIHHYIHVYIHICDLVGGYGEPLAAGAREAAGPITPGPIWYIDMRYVKYGFRASGMSRVYVTGIYILLV